MCLTAFGAHARPGRVLTFVMQHAGDTDSAQVELEKDTESKLKAIEASFEANRGSVVDKLLSRVVEVEPKLHRNLKHH